MQGHQLCTMSIEHACPQEPGLACYLLVVKGLVSKSKRSVLSHLLGVAVSWNSGMIRPLSITVYFSPYVQCPQKITHRK